MMLIYFFFLPLKFQVAKYRDPRDACAAIVAESYRLWLQYETRTDDITVIVVHINGLTDVIKLSFPITVSILINFTYSKFKISFPFPFVVVSKLILSLSGWNWSVREYWYFTKTPYSSSCGGDWFRISFNHKLEFEKSSCKK